MSENDIVKRLRAVDHMSVEDCFVQSHLFATAAAEIESLRAQLATDPERERLILEVLSAWRDWPNAETDRLQGALTSLDNHERSKGRG